LPPPPPSPFFPYTTLFRSRSRLQLQAQACRELPQGGGQGQSLRLLPRPFDRLQGAGRDPAAPLRHRSRRVGQGGNDAQNRRQEEDRKSTRLNSSHVSISYA